MQLALPGVPEPVKRLDSQTYIDNSIATGDLVAGCPMCERMYERWLVKGSLEGPRHRSRCGTSRSHCTCDSCF